MTTIKNLLLAALLLALPALSDAKSLTSFGGETFSLDSTKVPAPSPSASLPARTDAPAAAMTGLPLPQKKYTIALFMNGKNNLGVFMARKMMELEKIGSDANINIVMDIGVIKPVPACSTCAVQNMYGADWDGVRRFYVLKNPNPAAAKIGGSIRLPVAENEDMGDYKNLASFVNWAKTNFPAQKYIVVVGNHGGAWVDRKKKQGSAKGVSYDDVTGNYITTPEIGLALKEFGGADVLIFDDCLMQASEVAAEVRGQVPFLLGSEEISYTNHFKPSKLFAPLKANPDMAPSAFVDSFMRTWASYNTALWNSVKKYPGTFSAIEPQKIAGLEALTKRYAAEALALNDPEAKLAFRGAMKEVLRYHYEYCVDFYDFVELSQKHLKAKIAEGKLKESQKTRDLDITAEEIKSYIISDMVLYNFRVGTNGAKDYSKSHGITIFVPAIKAATDPAAPTVFIAPGSLQTKYTDLQFDKNTSWSAFVKYLVTN